MKQRLLAFALLLTLCAGLLPVSASASQATSGSCGENLTWEYDSSSWTLTISGTGEMWSYTVLCPAGDIQVPWYYLKINTIIIEEGVTHIGGGAFYNNPYLTRVSLPSTLIEIGRYAFYACPNLAHITLPEGLTTLADGAFYYCTGLTSLDIPDGVTYMGDYCLAQCTSLTSLTLPEGLVEIGDIALSGCGFASVTIPKNVAVIGSRVFGEGLQEIRVHPENANFSAKDGVLYNKDGTELLAYPRNKPDTHFAIPEGVVTVGDYALAWNESITALGIPESLAAAEDFAFCRCTNLTDVYYAGSSGDWRRIDFGDYNDSVTADATLHYNASLPPAPAPVPASGTAYAGTETILLDGKVVELPVYALRDAQGYPTNYVKLRDFAYLLNGTAAQFNCYWDDAMCIDTGAAYAADGTEFNNPFTGNRSYTVPTAELKIDGAAAKLAAISLTDDSGGGYTYFQIRDLARTLDFYVAWDDAAQCIVVETGRAYGG